MSVDYSVVGIKPPDEKWKQMKAIWDACSKADVEIPEEVGKFFGWDEPDPSGVRVNLDDYVTERDEDPYGYEVDIKNLPKDVTIVRFVVSY